jgi:hypothetical protein
MKAVTGSRLDGERDIVERGIIVQQLRDLESARQPAFDARRRGKTADLFTRQVDRPRILGQLAGDLQDQRGLARAVRADDGVQLVASNVERQITGGDQSAEAFDQPFDAKQGIIHRRLVA